MRRESVETRLFQTKDGQPQFHVDPAAASFSILAMKLVVEPIWTWPSVILAILALLVIVLVTYPPRVRHLPAFPRRFLIGLRLAAALTLSFGMLRPELQSTTTDKKSISLLLAADASRSMGTRDAPGSVSRRAALLKTLDDAQPEIEALQLDLELLKFDFDSEVHEVTEFTATADGNETAIGAALDEMAKRSRTDRLAGIVLLSDGAQRSNPPRDVDPRAIARRLGELQIPVYTVGFGTSELSTSTLDLAVDEMLVDPLAFEKKSVPVTARVRLLGAANRAVTVRLLVEDLTGKKLGESGELKVPPASRNAVPTMTIDTKENSTVIPVDLSFVPERAGEYKIAVEVIPLEGELKQGNNRRETLITVRRGGINVAYFDIATRNEQKFLRGINAEQIQLDWYQVRAGIYRNLTKIDPAVFAPGRYDVFIIGDVPADVFGPTLLNQMALRVHEGAGLLMTGGFHNFGAGGYARTPLDELLPVTLNPADVRRDEEVDESQHYLRDLQMLPTSHGLRHYVMRIAPSDENRERWASLFPLSNANKLRKKNDSVEVLAQADDGIDLLFAHETGAARVMAFAGDTTWLWAMHGDREAHQRFWRQVILWLARKEQDSDQEVWVRVDPRNFHSGARVPITFGTQDEQGAPIPGVSFEVQVHGPDEKVYDLSAVQSGEEFLAEFSDTQKAGDYWVHVNAVKDGARLGFTAVTRFIVDAQDLEMDNPAADLGLLQEIAKLTGGTSIPPEDLGPFLERMRDNGALKLEETLVTRVTLWDNWYFLAVFVSLMTLEWVVRKTRGLV